MTFSRLPTVVETIERGWTLTLHDILYLKESWFIGMSNSHDEESNEDQQMEEEGGN